MVSKQSLTIARAPMLLSSSLLLTTSHKNYKLLVLALLRNQLLSRKNHCLMLGRSFLLKCFLGEMMAQDSLVLDQDRDRHTSTRYQGIVRSMFRSCTWHVDQTIRCLLQVSFIIPF